MLLARENLAEVELYPVAEGENDPESGTESEDSEESVASIIRNHPNYMFYRQYGWGLSDEDSSHEDEVATVRASGAAQSVEVKTEESKKSSAAGSSVQVEPQGETRVQPLQRDAGYRDVAVQTALPFYGYWVVTKSWNHLGILTKKIEWIDMTGKGRVVQSVPEPVEPRVGEACALARPPKPRPGCWNCGDLEHRFNACEAPFPRPFCFACGEKGFIADHCPYRVFHSSH